MTEKNSESLNTLETITINNSRVRAEVKPQGAFLESLSIDGKEIIYKPLKENPGRGGIPILGPTPGHIKDRAWEHLYPNMPTHGIDRKVLWNIVEVAEDRVIFSRQIGPKEFLFSGAISVKISLLDNGVSISKIITNNEDKPREIGHGFHPYFTVTKDVSYKPQKIELLHPLTPGKAEIIKPGIASITITDSTDIYTIEASPKPTQTVVWTDSPDKYECIEPWWAESGKGDILGPNESKTYTLLIRKVDSE